jgi:hypothetical protein
MGMRKISEDDEKSIVRSLRRWPVGRRLSWDILRDSLADDNGCGLDQIWSRQSLSASESIYFAFSEAKKRVTSARRVHLVKAQSSEQYEQTISDLKAELLELQSKYDRLLVRHTQLCYNASLLEGGGNLLSGSLPDNTRSQGG